jgi:hypothetical protein
MAGNETPGNEDGTSTASGSDSSVLPDIIESWQSTYFSREEREYQSKKTGNMERCIFSVCKLNKSKEDVTKCQSAYIYNRSYGTGNLIRHLRNKHGIEVVPTKLPLASNCQVIN